MGSVVTMSMEVIILNKYLYAIFAAVGFIFLRSGYGKFSEGKFVAALGETLDKFASKNPYPPVKGFLETIAIPNSQIFGYLTMYGELFAGLALTLGCLYLIFARKSNRLVSALVLGGLLTGAFLNFVFWVSAGWTSASTESVNLVMLLVQLVGIVFVGKTLNSKVK